MGGLRRLIHKKKKTSGGHTESLCWSCIHAVPSMEKGTGCIWSRSVGKIPVDGCEYQEKTSFCKNYKNGKLLLKTMTKCPEYQQDVKAGQGDFSRSEGVKK